MPSNPPAHRPVEFDISYDFLGNFLQLVSDKITHPGTSVTVNFRGPGGGNPQLFFTFGSDTDSAAVKQILREQGASDSDINLYFTR